MNSNYVLPILLATVCSLLPMARAPLPGLDSAKSFASSSIESVNIAEKYSFRNAYKIHSGCSRWCWLVINKVARQECYKTKKTRCEEKKNFSYRSFIVFHLSKFGMGKLASSALGVPETVVKAGIQAGGATFSAVVSGTVAVKDGVGTGTKVLKDGVVSGTTAAGETVGAGSKALKDGLVSGTTAAGETVGAGSKALKDGVTTGATAAADAVGTGTKKVGEGLATGTNTLVSGAGKIGSGLAGLGRSPSFMRSKRATEG